MVIQQELRIKTNGRGTQEITDQVHSIIQSSNIVSGLCNLFIQHTSASLILCENADPTVRADLENFMSRIAVDGDPTYLHNTEGPDDMPAHIRTTLTESSITIPLNNGHCLLGTWQGIYLWEHRHHGYERKIIITLYGE